MGVRGLAEILSDFLDETPWQRLAGRTRVLIDGAGWAFHLLGGLARHHGGDYAALEARVEEVLQNLSDAGLAPEVWWDGARTRMKARTKRKRADGRLEEERRLFQYCVDGAMQVTQASLPPPPMFTLCVRHALARLGVPQVVCEYEADPAMAAESAATGAIVHALDSDFVFMEGCRYVPFGYLKLGAGGGGQMQAKVLTRAALAKSFDVNESILVEWAIFLGNDFTGPLIQRGKAARQSYVLQQAKNTKAAAVERGDAADNSGDERARKQLEDTQTAIFHDALAKSFSSRWDCTFNALLTLQNCLVVHVRDDADANDDGAGRTHSVDGRLDFVLTSHDGNPDSELNRAILFSRCYYAHDNVAQEAFGEDEDSSRTDAAAAAVVSTTTTGGLQLPTFNEVFASLTDDDISVSLCTE